MSRRVLSPKARWVLKVAVVILWLFGIVATYFWIHKPFDASIVLGVGQSLLGVAAWLGITWLGAALGRRAGGRLLVGERPGTRLALSAGIGLGLLSLLVLGLGLVGLLQPVVGWGLVLVLGAVLWRDLRTSLDDLRAVQMEWPADGFQRWLLVYGSVSLLLTFLLALAPPTGWDTLVYHLTGPRFFVEAGRIVHPVDLAYLGFPELGEMQFVLGLLLVGDRVAPLFHFGYGLLALAVTTSLARRVFGQDVAWLAATFLLSVPTLLSLMARAYVDATLFFYAIAAFYALLRWRELWAQADAANGKKWLSLMGLCCGFCGGVKYTAIAIPFALVLSVAWISRRDGLRAVAGRWALVAVIAILVVLPWLLENWLTAGNPVYPFFFPGGVYWDEWRGRWYDRSGTGLAATAPWRLLTAPVEATILGTEGTPMYDATIGPLLLTGVALLVAVWHSLNREERAIVGHMLLFLAVNYALWLGGAARTTLLLQTRLLFPVFGLVAVLGGLAVDRLRALRCSQLDVAWLAWAVVSLTLALLLFSTLTQFLLTDPLPVVLGLESRDDYLGRRLGWYYVATKDMNRELPPDSNVLFLWEPRAYYCQIQCWPDALLDRFLHATHLYGHDAGAIASAWRTQGFTHVLLYRTGYEVIAEAGFDPIAPADVQTLETLVEEYLQPVAGWGNAYALYALNGP